MNFGNHEPRETVHGREKYKWVLLVFLFAAFFLELGSRQLYSAALPQIRLEFLRYGVTDAQLGMVGTVFGGTRSSSASWPASCAAKSPTTPRSTTTT